MRTIRFVEGWVLALFALAPLGCSAPDAPGAASDALGQRFRCILSRALRGAGDIAVDVNGDLLVATGPRTRGEGPGSVVRKFDKHGRLKWAHHVPDGDELLPFRMTTDDSGAVIVVGRGFRTEWLPHGVETIASWLFLLKLDADGNLQLRRDFKGGGSFGDVATTPQGEIVVRGRYSGSLDLGGGPMPDSGGPSTSFLGKFSAKGDLLWTKDFGNPDEQAPIGITTDDTGAVYVAGRFRAPFDFGGGFLTPTPNLDPDADFPLDAFLVKYDGSGHYVWSKKVGGEGGQWFHDIAVDAAGHAIVLGGNTGVVEFDGEPFVHRSDFVASFGPYGERLYSAAIPTRSGDSQRLGVSASGEVFVAGSFRGTMHWDSGYIMSAGGRDLFVLQLDSRGMVRRGERFGGVDDEVLWGFAVGPKGRIALAGDFEGTLDVGCGGFSTGPDVDAFVGVFGL